MTRRKIGFALFGAVLLLFLTVPGVARAGLMPPPFGPPICPGPCDPHLCQIRPWLCSNPTPPPSPPSHTDPEPEPEPCNEPVTAPSIYGFAYEPDYPLVTGQDPKRQGFTFRVKAEAGHDACGERFTLRGLEVKISLAPASANWVQTDLAKRYPGAHLQGYVVAERLVSLSGPTGLVRMRVLPYDPGVWLVQVTAVQSNGMSTRRTFEVPVYLLEGTLTEP